MPVDGGSGHAEQVTDLLDSVLASVVELLCKSHLLGGQPRPAAARPAASSRGSEPIASIRDDQLTLKLGQDGQHPEHRTPLGGRRIDALLDDVQSDATLAQLGTEGHEMQDRATETIQPRDFQRVAITQRPQDRVERRPARLRATRVIDVDVPRGHTRTPKGVDLMVRVLLDG